MSIAEIGHNSRETHFDPARKTFRAVSQFLAVMPVIETEEDAREAKWHLDHAKATLKDLEAEQKKETGPLYAAWRDAIAKYKQPIEHLEKITSELAARLTAFMRREEERRQAEALALRKAADEAGRQADQAIEAEQDARENAAMGEVGIDLGSIIHTTDEAIDDAKYLGRKADLAERDSHVRIGGGLSGRVTTLREKKTLVLIDAIKAILAIGVTDKIRDAILSSARDYRKLKGELPPGVSEISEKGI